MESTQVIEHLFRHQHGRMVAILCRIFGLQHLETIEDAIQDTFIKASQSWRRELPENPEAWLTTAAKNRTIDLFRQLKSEKERAKYLENGPAAIAFNELFLDDEIADSQLRMIFTACHPALDPRDQIAFALKTIAGFSQKEIASALLSKEERIKKRLTRARKAIKEQALRFEIPSGEELSTRLNRVLEVVYLIFNEGFHSAKKEIVVRKDLCAEAMRLCTMLIDKTGIEQSNVKALYALMCFHASRLDSKVDEHHEIIDLRLQDRAKWYFPLIVLGNRMMNESVEITETYSSYHYEAAIASEHLRAKTFEQTNWAQILKWYECLQVIEPSPFNLLNMAVVNMQMAEINKAAKTLEQIDHVELEQRAYLYFGCMAELEKNRGNTNEALRHYDTALSLVCNNHERAYLKKKKDKLVNN